MAHPHIVRDSSQNWPLSGCLFLACQLGEEILVSLVSIMTSESVARFSRDGFIHGPNSLPCEPGTAQTEPRQVEAFPEPHFVSGVTLKSKPQTPGLLA